LGNAVQSGGVFGRAARLGHDAGTHRG
jgi:hypothetical protein